MVFVWRQQNTHTHTYVYTYIYTKNTYIHNKKSNKWKKRLSEKQNCDGFYLPYCMCGDRSVAWEWSNSHVYWAFNRCVLFFFRVAYHLCSVNFLLFAKVDRKSSSNIAVAAGWLFFLADAVVIDNIAVFFLVHSHSFPRPLPVLLPLSFSLSFFLCPRLSIALRVFLTGHFFHFSSYTFLSLILFFAAVFVLFSYALLMFLLVFILCRSFFRFFAELWIVIAYESWENARLC